MSHFSSLQTKIRDSEILVRSLKEMGYQVQTNIGLKGYLGGETRVDYAVRVGTGYDVGFRKNSDGVYEIVADWWGVKGTTQSKLVKELTDQVNKIQQEYAVNKVVEQTEKQGFKIAEKTQQSDGSIKILVRRWS